MQLQYCPGNFQGTLTYNIWLIFTTLSDIIRKKTSVLLMRKQHVSKSDTEVKQDDNGRGGDDLVLSWFHQRKHIALSALLPECMEWLHMEHGLLLVWQISYVLFILSTNTSSGNLYPVFLLSFVVRTSELNCFYETITQTTKQECFHQFICKQIYYSTSWSFPCMCVCAHPCGCRHRKMTLFLHHSSTICLLLETGSLMEPKVYYYGSNGWPVILGTLLCPPPAVLCPHV